MTVCKSFPKVIHHDLAIQSFMTAMIEEKHLSSWFKKQIFFLNFLYLTENLNQIRFYYISQNKKYIRMFQYYFKLPKTILKNCISNCLHRLRIL